MTPFEAWTIRYHVSAEALAELRAVLNCTPAPFPPAPANVKTEADVQSAVRLEGARMGVRLWRNNVGVLTDDRGVPVRYGLANDSARLNEQIKSSDLIGWRTVTIEPRMVGSTLAQFVAREIKAPGWRYTGSKHEAAQRRWLELVLADGGDAKFASGEGTF